MKHNRLYFLRTIFSSLLVLSFVFSCVQAEVDQAGPDDGITVVSGDIDLNEQGLSEDPCKKYYDLEKMKKTVVSDEQKLLIEQEQEELFKQIKAQVQVKVQDEQFLVIKDVKDVKDFIEDKQEFVTEESEEASLVSKAMILLESDYKMLYDVFFNRSQMCVSEKCFFDKFQIFFDLKIQAIKDTRSQAVESFGSSVDKNKNLQSIVLRQIGLLNKLILWQKVVFMKLEVLSPKMFCGQDVSAYGAESYLEYQSIALNVLGSFVEIVGKKWTAVSTGLITLDDLEKDFFSNSVITSLVLKELPKELRHRWFHTLKSFCWHDWRADLERFLRLDLFEFAPEMSDQLLLLVSDISNYKNGLNLKTKKDLLKDLRAMIILLERKKASILSSEVFFKDLQALKIYGFLQSKLLVMRYEIQQYEGASLNIAKKNILIYQKMLCDSELLKQVFLLSCSCFNKYFEKYMLIVDQYICTNTYSIEFCYKVSALIQNLDKLQVTYETSWLKSKMLGVLGFKKQPEMVQILFTMIQILKSVSKNIGELRDSGVQVKSVLQQIVSGEWEPKRNGAAVKALLPALIQKITVGQKNDARKIAFRILTYVSPFIAVGFLKFVGPYLSKNIGQKLQKFFVSEESSSDKKKKVTTFIENNNDVIQELIVKNPALMDQIVKAVIDKMCGESATKAIKTVV